MLFSGIPFLYYFLPAVVILYFLIPQSLKNGFLLLASLLFYAWGEPRFIFVMLLTVTVNYFCGLIIDRFHQPAPRTAAMVVGVALSLGFLTYFKYFGFFTDVILGLLGKENLFTKPTLPIGISFYTFQVLTYTVDVYRRKVPVQKIYAKLLLYVSFFPQLIAGPIVNYTDIAPSLDQRNASTEDVYEGFLRFFVGFGKKVLLANTCGIITDKLTAADSMSFAGSWLMILAYTFQIYFDFSGYSDMAIGMGRMFGFHFLENFNYPYISKSVTEFWRRWHISLGTFFREYVYIPLGGNRVCTWKKIRNILVVWLLTGFWHGASWNFLAWGVYYGLLLLAEKFLFRNIQKKLPGILNWALTFLLVMVGWVFFYYENIFDGLRHLGIMFGLQPANLTDPLAIYYFKHYLLYLVAAAAACFPWNIPASRRPGLENMVSRIKPLVLTGLFLLALAMIITQSYNPFLYFRF